jgi:hypothetical protein
MKRIQNKQIRKHPLTVAGLIALLRVFNPKSLARLDVPINDSDFHPVLIYDEPYSCHESTICAPEKGDGKREAHHVRMLRPVTIAIQHSDRAVL